MQRARALLSCLAWLLAAAGWLAAGAAQARGPATPAAVQVKAAYLLNFLRYTHWPQSGPEGPAPAVEVVVLGSDDLAAALRALLRQTGTPGHAVRVRRVDQGLAPARLQRELRGADVLYLGADTWPDSSSLLEELQGKPVLTVGDAPEFAQAGGMLGLVPQGPRIVFDANPAAIQASGLQVSAKVLKLARIVGPESPR
jgi:hypothetical protein